MGCDIHGVFQRKVEGAWLDIDSPYNWERDYDLFGFLANVRNYDIPYISEPRGLPDDLFRFSTQKSE
jgi:hypothetical protein